MVEEITSLRFETLESSSFLHLERFSNLEESSYLTRIDNLICLPSWAHPNQIRPNGVFKNKLRYLYEQHIHTSKNYEEIQREILNRWKNKDGRIRGNLCGKRVNFCARSVITPNPHLDLNQVGLPVHFKNSLLKKEPFDNQDIKDILYVLENDKRYLPRFKKPRKKQIIYRKLRNGERVLVNRQPTLSNQNIVAMKIIWQNYSKTIQLHPAIFSIFDADCDGDEMNIFLPQIAENKLTNLFIENSLFNFSKMKIDISVIQDATIGYCYKCGFKNNHEIDSHVLSKTNNDVCSLLREYKKVYFIGTKHAFYRGSTVSLSLKEIDRLIDTGSKGSAPYKKRIREFTCGIQKNNLLSECINSRNSIISTSLETARSGFLSRKLSYHLDDLIIVKNKLIDIQTVICEDIIIPHEFENVKHIGLTIVQAIIPPITQRILDSFHYSSAGININNDSIVLIEQLLFCKHPDISSFNDVKNLRKFFFQQFTYLFPNVHTFLIQILVYFITYTGKAIGFNKKDLILRYKTTLSYKQQKKLPVIKLLKFSDPKNVLKHTNDCIDPLDTCHSRDII